MTWLDDIKARLAMLAPKSGILLPDPVRVKARKEFDECAEADTARLVEEVDRLREAFNWLSEHGRHRRNCRAYMSFDACSCGLSEVLSAADEEGEG